MVHVTHYSSVLTGAIDDWLDQDVQGTANVGEPPGSTDPGWLEYVDTKFACNSLVFLGL